MSLLPLTNGDAVADLHRIAENRSLAPWTLGTMLVCFQAERQAGVPVHEAFNEALRQAGRPSRA